MNFQIDSQRLLGALLVVFATWLAPGTAQAQAEGEPATVWSIGVGIGTSQLQANESTVAREYPELQPGFRIDESTTGFRVVGSYHFDPVLALDLEFVELGDVLAEDASGRHKLFSISGMTTAVRARHRLSGSAEVFGRLGAFLWISTANVDNTVDDGLDITYGLGTDINLYGGFERVLRLEWDYYGFNGVTLDSASILSASLVFNF